jgi:hypothetical protein
MITRGLMTKQQWHGMGQNGGWFRTVLSRLACNDLEIRGSHFPGSFLFYCCSTFLVGETKNYFSYFVIFLFTCQLTKAIMLTREGVSIWGIRRGWHCIVVILDVMVNLKDSIMGSVQENQSHAQSSSHRCESLHNSSYLECYITDLATYI